MSVKIQTRSINPTVFNDLLAAGTDPLIARLCAARDVQSPAELDDKLAALLPYQTLTNCEAAAGRLADAVERKGAIHIKIPRFPNLPGCLPGTWPGGRKAAR